jgi:hypothetical protein
MPELNSLDEIHMEKLAKPISEHLVRVNEKESDAWILGSVLISHANDEQYDFFRTQFKKIARCTNGVFHFYPNADQFNTVADCVEITVSPKSGVAKFGPKGNIKMRNRGLGIGPYLMAKVILWAKENYPSFRCLKGELSYVDATDDNKDRRNKFYSKAGFNIRFDDPKTCETGRFDIDRLDKLSGEWNPNKVKEISVVEIAQLLADATQNAVKFKNQVKGEHDWNTYLEKKLNHLKKWRLILCAVIVFVLVFPGIAGSIHNILARALF